MKKNIAIFISLIILIFQFNSFALELHYVDEAGFEDRSESCVFENGVALVWKIGKSAVVNNYGRIIIDYSANPKAIMLNGLIAVRGENNKIGFFNSSGKMVTDYIYDAFNDVNDKTSEEKCGYTSTAYLRDGDGKSPLIPVSKDGKFGYINEYGTVVIPFKYDYAYGFSGGIARVCSEGILSDYGTYTNGKYGFIKENGTEILPPDSYWVAQDYDESLGYAMATNGETDTVFIDKNGKVHKYINGTCPEIDSAYIITNSQEGIYGVNDKSGNTVIPAQQSNSVVVNGDRFIIGNTLRDSNNKILYYAPEKGSLFTGIRSKNFVTVGISPDGPFGTTNYYGFIDWDGNVILEPVYDQVTDLGDELICARKDSSYMIFDYSGKFIKELSEKPVDAYDGFIALTDTKNFVTRIAVNPFKRPQIYIDNSKVTFTDAFPYYESQRTMIPLRSVFEEIGAEVNWDSNTGIISVEKDDLRLSMKIGEKSITIGDSVYETDVAPVVINNRTFVPLRVFSEGMGIEVIWEQENYTVRLNLRRS